MYKPVKKYDGRGSHRRAMLNLIGQLETVNRKPAIVSDIAALMKVSKPTAIKYLKRLADNEEIIMSKVDRTSNSKIWHITLTEDIYQEYHEGCFIRDYQEYCQKVLGIILW